MFENFSLKLATTAGTMFTALMLASSATSAVTFESRNFDALSLEAEQVVIGTALSSVSRRTGEREIVTDYTFANLDVVKGAVPSTTLTLTLLGGTVGSDTLAVGGAPKFQAGVRYLVFVAGNGSVMFPMVGGQQGIFQIRKDATSGVPQVHDYTGRPVLQLPGRRPDEKADTSTAETGLPISQADFVSAIRASIKANATATTNASVQGAR